MTTAETYFLAVAKYRSITRAAEALYLSHQNLSNYMKKLEQQYGLLFTRKPRFQLTPTGEALYETLRQIELLEASFHQRLSDLKHSEHGTFRVGMHASRSQVIIPEVLPQFRARYPGINVIIHAQNNIDSQQMLANGDLDLYLGADDVRRTEFHYEHLQNEPIRLAISAALLRSAGLSEHLSHISCQALPRFSLIVNPPESHFRTKIDHFCRRVGLDLSPSIVAPDFYLQLLLSAQGAGICFYPQSMRQHIETLNRTLPPEAQLCQLRVDEMDETTELTLVTHKLGYRSRPLQEFCHALRQAVSRLSAESL